MTELLDLLALTVPKDMADEKCKATHLFFGDVVRLFPFPKTSPVSSSKKLISIQRCRRLWGSFGLASYFTLNAIYWIMNLLCSSDRVNSVNSLSIHPQNRPLRSLSDPGWNSNEVFATSTGEYRKSDASVLHSENIGRIQGLSAPFRGGWGGYAALYCTTAWVCLDMLLNMKSEKKKYTWIKTRLADTLFMFCSFWGFHMSGHS